MYIKVNRVQDLINVYIITSTQVPGSMVQISAEVDEITIYSLTID